MPDVLRQRFRHRETLAVYEVTVVIRRRRWAGRLFLALVRRGFSTRDAARTARVSPARAAALLAAGKVFEGRRALRAT